MLGIDKGEVETRRGQDARNFRRAELRPARAELTLSGFERLFDTIDLHRVHFTATIEICSSVGQWPLALAALSPGTIC
jgi:hypothetical protein